MTISPLPNTIEKNGNARFRFTDDYEINTYDKDKKTFASGAIMPDLAYNPDHGFASSLEFVKTINKFKRNPFTSQHSFTGKFHSATSGFKLAI